MSGDRHGDTPTLAEVPPMSKLATKLAPLGPPERQVRRGPANVCHPVYGDGDLDDWREIERLRADGHTWREVQAIVDGLLKIERPIHNDKFRRHWRRACFCWPEEHRP
jgi:hypothetical protein